MRKTCCLALGGVALLLSLDVAAQIRPPGQPAPVVQPALPAGTARTVALPTGGGVVCIPYRTDRGLIFHCKSRADIRRDVGRAISPQWADRFERDYRGVAGLLGLDPESGSFAVCPQGGAFGRVDLTAGALQQQAAGGSRTVRALGSKSPGVFEISGSTAQQIDAGCANAGGGIGPRGEYTGNRSRGGRVTYEDFMAAGGTLNKSQWGTLTGNTVAMFQGMTCHQGSNTGLVAATVPLKREGAPSGQTEEVPLWAIWAAKRDEDTTSAQAERAEASADSGVGASELPSTRNPDGSTTTRSLVDGDLIETTTLDSPGASDSVKEIRTFKRNGSFTQENIYTDKKTGSELYVRSSYDKDGRLVEETTSSKDASGRGWSHTETYGPTGRPSGSAPGARRPSSDPSEDRSCSAQQAWVDNFVRMCSAINWQSGPCFQAVLLANQCVDPRNMTPTPDGPEMICANAGKGPRLESREEACKKNSLIALAYPNSEALQGCGSAPVQRVRDSLAPRPGLINPVREGAIEVPPSSGAPPCDPRDPRCGPQPRN